LDKHVVAVKVERMSKGRQIVNVDSDGRGAGRRSGRWNIVEIEILEKALVGNTARRGRKAH
jgi:hypothetical protein